MSCNSLSSSSEEAEYDFGGISYFSCNHKIKTELCRAYLEGEICKFGEFCKFAHGWYELRSMPQQDKPIRKKCYGYWGSNECRYGMSCKF